MIKKILEIKIRNKYFKEKVNQILENKEFIKVFIKVFINNKETNLSRKCIFISSVKTIIHYISNEDRRNHFYGKANYTTKKYLV